MKKNIQQFAIAVALCVAIPTFANCPKIDMNESRANLCEIGAKFVSQNFPEFNTKRKTPVLRDMGDNWEFTYELPKDMLGGAPVVVIDKRTRRVLDTYRTQ